MQDFHEYLNETFMENDQFGSFDYKQFTTGLMYNDVAYTYLYTMYVCVGSPLTHIAPQRPLAGAFQPLAESERNS